MRLVLASHLGMLTLGCWRAIAGAAPALLTKLGQIGILIGPRAPAAAFAVGARAAFDRKGFTFAGRAA